MKNISGLLAAMLVLAGCGNIPSDLEGTADRVREAGILRVGIVSPRGTISPAKEAAFVRRVGLATNAKPEFKEGPAEILLEDLEQGKLDLVLGEFSTKSPWATLVHFTPPLAEKITRDGHSLLTAAVRHGENEWVSILHREAVAVAGGEE